MGKLYPRFLFIMEGDTPSFLGLIDNGLNAYRRPDWGGWGGRYVYRQPYGEQHSIWSQGGDEFQTAPPLKTESIGMDGAEYTSDQATIWRWREAYQNDFAARMDWTIRDFAHAKPQSGTGREWRAWHWARLKLSSDANRIITLDCRREHGSGRPGFALQVVGL